MLFNKDNCRIIDVSRLVVSLWLYYLPRDFSSTIALCVYVPPRVDAGTACGIIPAIIARMQMQHLEAFIAISGDFDHITLDLTLTMFYPYVDCPTRKKTGQLIICILVWGMHTAPARRPPLGKSESNLVYLQPQYKPRVQRQPTMPHSFRKWSPETEETALSPLTGVCCRNHMERTLRWFTRCMMDYLNFCMDIEVPGENCAALLTTSTG